VGMKPPLLPLIPSATRATRGPCRRRRRVEARARTVSGISSDRESIVEIPGVAALEESSCVALSLRELRELREGSFLVAASKPPGAWGRARRAPSRRGEDGLRGLDFVPKIKLSSRDSHWRIEGGVGLFDHRARIVERLHRPLGDGRLVEGARADELGLSPARHAADPGEGGLGWEKTEAARIRTALIPRASHGRLGLRVKQCGKRA